MVKNPPAMQETQVWSLGGKIPWRREWLPTPVFLSGKFHEQRSWVGYSPAGGKDSDTTKQLTRSHAMPDICMHLYYLPAPVFMTNITVILPLFMWFFEWLSSPRDCEVHATSIIVFACHIVDVHWINEWNTASNLTFAVRNSVQNTQPGEPKLLSLS